MIDVIKNAPENLTIQNAMCVMRQKLDSFYSIGVAVSGGSDSDIIVDLISRILPTTDYKPDVKYFFYNTGLEYEATKRHLKDLEDNYHIKINVINAIKPIPAGCHQYGVPFFSKKVSDYIGRLQKHNFEWENDTYDTLNEKYPNCQTALRWWCNEWGENSSFNIDKSGKHLKAFMQDTPPMISKSLTSVVMELRKRLLTQRTRFIIST